MSQFDLIIIFRLRIPEIPSINTHLLKDEAPSPAWKENVDSKFESTIQSAIKNQKIENSVSVFRIMVRL